MLARFARGPRFESRSGLVLLPHPSTPPPVTFGGSVWVRAQTASSKGIVSSRWYLHGSEQIRERIYLSRGKLSRVDRLARLLVRYGRAPGFESRSSHVLFPPLWHLFHDQFRCRSHWNKHYHPGFGAGIQEESHRSRCQSHSGVVTRIVTFFFFFFFLFV